MGAGVDGFLMHRLVAGFLTLPSGQGFTFLVPMGMGVDGFALMHRLVAGFLTFPSGQGFSFLVP